MRLAAPEAKERDDVGEIRGCYLRVPELLDLDAAFGGGCIRVLLDHVLHLDACACCRVQLHLQVLRPDVLEDVDAVGVQGGRELVLDH